MYDAALDSLWLTSDVNSNCGFLEIGVLCLKVRVLGIRWMLDGAVEDHRHSKGLHVPVHCVSPCGRCQSSGKGHVLWGCSGVAKAK